MAEYSAASGLATVVPMLAYAVIIEAGPPNYSAYVPDAPGCIATGQTVEEVTERMREALTGHLALMRDSGESIPEPRTQVTLVQVPNPAVS